MDGFEWDEKKNESNIGKHGVGFELAALIWEGWVLEAPDDRRDYGEDRFIALGAVEGRVLVIVYTWRAHRRRIISARKGNTHEQEIYHSAIARYGSSDTG